MVHITKWKWYFTHNNYVDIIQKNGRAFQYFIHIFYWKSISQQMNRYFLINS